MNEQAEPPVLGALELTIQDYRRRYRNSLRPEPWYAHLPSWLVHEGGRTFEECAAQFDESAKKIDVRRTGLVGFETEYYPGHVRRHRISWLDGGAPQPATGKDPG